MRGLWAADGGALVLSKMSVSMAFQVVPAHAACCIAAHEGESSQAAFVSLMKAAFVSLMQRVVLPLTKVSGVRHVCDQSA